MTTTLSGRTELKPATSWLPLTPRPSERTSTPRRSGFCSTRASFSPAAKDSAALPTSNIAASRVVLSKRVTETVSVRSRTVVPTISPALEQPISLALG